MPEFAMITFALAFDEVKARLLQIADEFSDFAGHGYRRNETRRKNSAITKVLGRATRMQTALFQVPPLRKADITNPNAVMLNIMAKVRMAS